MSERSRYLLLDLPGYDTQIVVSNRKMYRVHSVQLRNSSPLLASLLDPRRRHHLIVLQNHDTYSGEAVTPVLRSLDVKSSGQPGDHYSIMHEEEDDDVRKSMYNDYHRIICSMFGRDIKLKTSNIVSLLRDSVGMVETAEYLGSVHLIAKTIESALLSQGQTLFRAIAANPIEWIDLAYRIKSKVVFKDSLIHLTGQYNTLLKQPPSDKFLTEHPHTRSVLDTMNPILRDLVEAKAKRMKIVCMDMESRIISHYPPNLQRDSVTGRADRDNIGRVSYQKDIFAWQGLTCYRHWIGQQMANNETHNAPDGGHDFYTKLSLGGQNYLDRDTVAGFHTFFPMSAKGKSVLEANINSVKAAISDLVKPLLKNKSQLDVERYEVKWLTCLHVSQDDYVFEGKGKGRADKGRKRGIEEV